jgi:hypothetical protein
MFNVYKNQQSRQTGSRIPMGPKTLPMIWGTYMVVFVWFVFTSVVCRRAHVLFMLVVFVEYSGVYVLTVYMIRVA